MDDIKIEQRLSPLRRQQEAYRRWQLARTVLIREIKIMYNTLSSEMKSLVIAEMKARNELEDMINTDGFFHDN